MFGNSSFAFGSSTPTLGTFGSPTQPTVQTSGPIGTTIRFVPLSGTDTVQKAGTSTGPSQITTRHQNISAMKEYESKSVDELRLEDYAANRKVGQPQTGFSATPFGSMQPSTSQPSTSIFGTSSNQSAPNLFGATPTQNQSTNLFGQSNNTSSIFNSPLNKPQTTVASSPFSLGTTFNATAPTSGAQNSGFSLFNNNPQANPAPFGQSNVNSPFKTNMFSTPASNTGSIFNTNSTGVQQQQQQQPGFSAAPFGSMQPPTSQQSTSIFGASTSQPTPSLFGATQTQNQTTNIFGQTNNASSIFNSTLNKPQTTVASSPFSLGTTFSTNTPTSGAQNTGFSLFNNNTQANAAPFGQSNVNSPFKTNMFSTPTSNTGSIFNTNTQTTNLGLNTNLTTTTSQPQPFGASTSLFGATNNQSSFGTTNSLFNTNATSNSGGLLQGNKPTTTTASSLLFGINPSLPGATQPATMQQNTSIFGTSTNLSASSLIGAALTTSSIGQTNTSLNFTSDSKPLSQFKVNAKTSVKLNKSPSTEKSASSSVLFDGLDDNGADDLKCAIDVFVFKKNINSEDLSPSNTSGQQQLTNFSSDSFGSIEPPTSQQNESILCASTNQSTTSSSETTQTQNHAINEPPASQQNESVLCPSVNQSTISLFESTQTQDQALILREQNDSTLSICLDTNTANQFKINAKKSVKLSNSMSVEKPMANSVFFDGLEDNVAGIGASKSVINVYSLKGNTRRQKIHKMDLKPDLYAGRNKMSRDIMSMCVSGSPKVRFFNGSRKFCYIQGDTVIVNELKLVPTSGNGKLSPELEEKFETFLENNSLITSPNMNPILAPYIETYDFISDASSHELLYALYGNLSSKTPYAKQNERLNRVISWLAATNQKLTPPPSTNLYQQVIHYMSCDRYDLASSLAVENNHPRLALLVATLNLSKDLMFEQLSSWRLNTADQYIDPELLKIYVLLSGLTEWKLSNGVTIHCLKGLKWTQQLCLLALHVTSFVTEPEKYGFHLLPLYIKRLDTDTNDVDYHILARHNPANALSAAKSLIEEWFLLESLKSFHVINTEAECLNSDMIHCNLVSQLGPIDLRWACFVALHIINNEVRNQVLIKCLEQNQDQFKGSKQEKSLSGMTLESWLIEKLKIPKEFIDNSIKLAQ